MSFESKKRGVFGLSGGFLGGVWEVSWRCMRGVWGGVWGVSGDVPWDVFGDVRKVSEGVVCGVLEVFGGV